MTNFKIRPERAEDRTQVAILIAKTYLGEGARTIEVAGKLREMSQPELCFVAEKEGEAKAFALFTPLKIKDSDKKALLLTPIAVDTMDEEMDIQDFLKQVFESLKKSSYDAVVVHGSAELYTPFGFTDAKDLNLTSELSFKGASFMALPLKHSTGGEVLYPEFLKKN